MRRSLVLLLCLALVLTGCAGRRDEAPKRTLAVFAIQRAGTGLGFGTATVVVVDPGERSIVASVPVERAFTVSDVSTAPGSPRVIVGTLTGFREIDLESRKVETLTVSEGEQPFGADYLRDGTAVVWHGTNGRRGLVVRHLSGPTETSATVDFVDYFRSRGMTGEGRGEDLMLMSADDANAYFVSSRPLPGTPGDAVSSVWRADFREGIVTRAGGTAPWPRSFPQLRGARGEEAVMRWGIPRSGEPTGVSFIGLDGEEQALLTSVPVNSDGPGIVFEPGGETFFATARTAAGVRITHRSLDSEDERVVASETVSPGGFGAPLALIGNAFAYARVEPSAEATSMWSLQQTQLRIRDVASGRDATVLSVPSIQRYSPRITYLGTYQLR